MENFFKRKGLELSCQLFNIGAAADFAEVLASKLLKEYIDNPLDLSEVVILLPNRRACKTLADAFVRLQGMQPTLLPQLRPLGDVEEDELALCGPRAEEAENSILPAVERAERLMLFIKIIMTKPDEFGLEKMSLNQACFLAQELAKMIDTVNSEELSFANLKNLVPEEYAGHWQDTLKFLEIITTFWPSILAERGCSDPSLRQRELLKKQSEIWKNQLPTQRIIIAGTTATFPAMKQLVKTVLELPRGEVILSGLDKLLDEESWAEIDETHPQYEFKELLDFLNIKRCDVEELVTAGFEKREKFISEVMRPAPTTDKWRKLPTGQIDCEAVCGLKIVNSSDVREEALSIALIMREALETPEKTAALVTPDRNLARRVAAELERWNIKVDDSAGRPLAVTPAGAFLRLVVKANLPGAGRLDWLSLLKHPFCGCGMDYATVRKLTRKTEQKLWRGEESDEELETFIKKVQNLGGRLRELCLEPKASLKEMIAETVYCSERLAATDTMNGEQILWRSEAGEVAAHFIAEWYEKAAILGEIETAEFLGLLEAMMAGIMVRPKFGTHPRLKILGPIEARLSRFDTIIIGEVNEGIWPQAPGSDPWMSRPMKKDFGLPQPEKTIGVLGLDFSHLLGGKEVYLTRAERVQGTPMVKSRWLMRLETVLKAAGLEAETLKNSYFKCLAQQLDRPVVFKKVQAPAPRPPVNARPRQLSASGIELLMRDPYSVFAKYILRLKKLEEIEPDLTMADYGTVIHSILEEFNNHYRKGFPSDAEEKLLALGRQKFADNHLALERRAFWWPNFEKIVKWLVKVETIYRPEIKRINNEIRGSYCFQAPAGEFTITAKADRVDETKDGKLNIIDYKTGKARSVKEVSKGFAPQLPIEGIIAQMGGFEEIKPGIISKLIYWQLAKKETIIEENMEQILEETEQHLQQLIALFDFQTTAYICHPNPKRIPEYSDYEHLARVKEWSIQSDDE